MAQSEEQKVRHMIAKLLWYEYICRVLCHCSLINWYTLINDTIKCWKSKQKTTKRVVTITTKLDKNSPSNKLLTTVYIQDSKNNKHTSTHYSRTLVLLLFFPRRVSSQESSNLYVYSSFKNRQTILVVLRIVSSLPNLNSCSSQPIPKYL